jgi:hypothetical protein
MLVGSSHAGSISSARRGYKTKFDGRLCEIVIVPFGYLNRTTYLVKQQVPPLLAPRATRLCQANANQCEVQRADADRHD